METRMQIPVYGLRRLLVAQDFDYVATLIFNRTIDHRHARKLLSQHHQRCDQKILGPNYYKMELSQRTLFFAFAEDTDSNFHYHLLIKVPKRRGALYEKIFGQVWQSLCPGGSQSLDAINNVGALYRSTSYCTKRLWEEEKFSSFIVSSEFVISKL